MVATVKAAHHQKRVFVVGLGMTRWRTFKKENQRIHKDTTHYDLPQRTDRRSNTYQGELLARAAILTTIETA